ncbi:MAG: glycosyl transferase family 1, partial [Pseudomonadota bacterium]|nr:glycosyl transferase family 1 [Pseudomonadota bacterium]
MPGIGDMVWHLPHIRAIAAYAGAPVTLLAKPRSLADQLVVNEPAIADILWIDLNPDGRRGAHDGIGGFRRLIRKLRT